jgi:hypothetical protein
MTRSTLAGLIITMAVALVCCGCGGGDDGAAPDNSVTPQNTEHAAAAADTFVPGSSVGLVVLGDTYADVKAIYGEPEWTYNQLARFSKVGAVVTFTGSETILSTDTVTYVYADTAFTGTYRGIGIGSSVNAVISAMGGGQVSTNGDTIDYYEAGIIYNVKHNMNVIDGLGIFAPLKL